MDELEILRLECKALRMKASSLEAEVLVLRRFRALVERSTELVHTALDAANRKCEESWEPGEDLQLRANVFGQTGITP